MSEVMINGVEQPLVGSTFPENENSLNDIVLKPGVVCPRIDGNDDELTNLTWLQDTNLLKSINVGSCENSDPGVVNCINYNNNLVDSAKKSQRPKIYLNSNSQSFVPYNPNVHVNAKPPYSFSCLIFMAIEHSENKALPVKDIYSWMLLNFPYFQTAPTGWKNSVRHNLSLNKCFRKVDKNMKPTTMVKGSYWSVDKQYRPNLLQALRRSSYQPYHSLLMLSGGNTPVESKDQETSSDSSQNSSKAKPNDPSPDLFPFLSKRLQETRIKKPEVDAAAAMIAMKNGKVSLEVADIQNTLNNCPSDVRRKNIKWRDRNRKRKNTVPVITISPSEDHTYSSSRSSRNSSPSSSSIDESFSDSCFNEETLSDVDCCESRSYDDEFSSSDDSEAKKRRLHLEEEQKKIADGADALLNLAGVASSCQLRKSRKLNKLNKVTL